jgi:tetratricopeptide (TPR) repeat protein
LILLGIEGLKMGKTKIFSTKFIIVVLLAFSAFTVYSNSLFSSFHLDDMSNIIENSDVTIQELTYDSLKVAAFTKVSGLRPVSYLSFAINYYYSGGDTFSYHAINTLIHVINAFLIYLIILRLFGYSDADDENRDKISISAFFTALIWLVAPINSQAVIYIVQRMTLLTTLFFLLAFYMYILGRYKEKVIYFILCGLFFLLSILSKQNGVVLPLVIVTYELIMVRRGEVRGLPDRQKGLLAFMLVAMIILVVIFSGKIHESIVRGYAIRDFTMYERLLTQSRVLVFYISLLALPLPGRFCLTHEIAKSTSPFAPVTTIFALLFIVALIVISVVRAKKSPYLSFALIWFFVTMSVESTFLPLEQVFEHRMYLPCVFLIGAFVEFLVSSLHKRSRTAVILIPIIIAILFSVSTYERGKVWEDEIALWGDVVQKYPEDGRGHYNLGTSYNLLAMYKEAEPHLSIALDKKLNAPHLKYKLSAVYNNLGIVQLSLGDVDKAEQNFIKTIETEEQPGLLYKAHSNLGWIYYIKQDYEKAILKFNEALKLNPDHSYSYKGLGDVYFKLKEYDISFKAYRKALERDPTDSFSYSGIGNIYLEKENYKDALNFFKMALHYNPENKKAKKSLEDVMEKIKQKQ